MTHFAVAFDVAGIPKAQPRARAFVRGRHAGVYNPATADDWKAAVYLAAIPHKPAGPITGPVEVDIAFRFPRPKRLMRQSDPDGQIRHTAKPDRDNCEKAVLDILTQCGYWLDDAQVCAGQVTKHYHSKTGAPGAHIFVRQLEER